MHSTEAMQSDCSTANTCNPGGIKFVIDQGHPNTTPPSQQPQAGANFFEILPADKTPTATIDSYIEEVPDNNSVRKVYDSYQLALAHHKEKTSDTGPASMSPNTYYNHWQHS